MAREKSSRAKKDSFKKRESKVGVSFENARPAPEPKPKDVLPSESSPLRYKLAPPKPSDFEPARGPVFVPHHTVPGLDGSPVDVFETSEQSVASQVPADSWHR